MSRYDRSRRDAIRDAAAIAARVPGVAGVFVVIATEDGCFTAGGHHAGGLDRLALLAQVGADHMKVEREAGRSGAEYDAEDAAGQRVDNSPERQ